MKHRTKLTKLEIEMRGTETIAKRLVWMRDRGPNYGWKRALVHAIAAAGLVTPLQARQIREALELP